MYGDIWLIYAQHLDDYSSKYLGQRYAMEFRLLLVYRRDCTVYITGNMSLCLMCSNLEEGAADGQMVFRVLDLLVTVAEWDT